MGRSCIYCVFGGTEQCTLRMLMEETPASPSLRGSHVSRILLGDSAIGSERNILRSRCLFALLEPLAVAPYCSSLVWLGHRISHPQEIPPSGPGKDPSTHTPGVCMCVGGRVECFLLSRSGKRCGDHLGALPAPTSLLGKCPVQCPFHGHLPPPSCAWA